MATIPATEPTEIRAGDTILWTRDDLTADYPAPTWTLKYYLVSPTKQEVITATAYGTAFSVNVPKATSAAYVAGTYTMTAIVSTATYAYTIKTSTITILPNLSVATAGLDTRTHAKTMLDAIESTLQGKATDKQLDLLSKTIGDKNIQRNPELLIKWRDVYKQEYQKELAAERISQGLDSPRRIGVRFNRI